MAWSTTTVHGLYSALSTLTDELAKLAEREAQASADALAGMAAAAACASTLRGTITDYDELERQAKAAREAILRSNDG